MTVRLLLAKLLTLACLAAPVAAQAAAAAAGMTVEAVQMPAWVERDGGRRAPVYAGMELRNRDQLRTGAQARLLLRTADGSSVKLGENATFRLEGLAQAPGANVFTASLHVLEGAFRFTTDALSRFRGKRDVRVVLPAVTTGIRGTDLWGKSAPERQLVCLIEGSIELTPEGEKSFVLNRPLQFYVREKGRSLPVATVDPGQLRQWATETDIVAGRGAARRGGRFKVTLGTFESQPAALGMHDQLREAGYPAEIQPGAVEGDRRLYAVRLTRLPARADAEALADSLKGRFGIETPRISM